MFVDNAVAASGFNDKFVSAQEANEKYAAQCEGWELPVSGDKTTARNNNLAYWWLRS